MLTLAETQNSAYLGKASYSMVQGKTHLISGDYKQSFIELFVLHWATPMGKTPELNTGLKI